MSNRQGAPSRPRTAFSTTLLRSMNVSRAKTAAEACSVSDCHAKVALNEIGTAKQA